MGAVEILFILDMFLWFLGLLPPAAPFAAARPFLAWVAVALLGFSVYAGVR